MLIAEAVSEVGVHVRVFVIYICIHPVMNYIHQKS